MGGKDAQRRHPGHPGGEHVFLVALDQDEAAHGAGILHPIGGCDRDHQDRDRKPVMGPAIDHGAGHSVDQQRDEDRREAELHVGDAHDDRVDEPAEIAADEAERDADRRGKQDARATDNERGAQAEDDGREHVAAQRIGAEQVAVAHQAHGTRRQPRIDHVGDGRIVGIVGRDEIRRRCGRDDRERQESGDERDRRAKEVVEEVAVPPARRPLDQREGPGAHDPAREIVMPARTRGSIAA